MHRRIEQWRGLNALLAALTIVVAALLTPAHARAAGYSDMVIDVNSGQILHETNADEERFPASLAKMMTIYIVFDMIERHRLSMDTMLTISEYGAAAQPSKLGLQPGDTISVSDGIKALVTASANDVARAIAENLGGDEEKFAKYMTWQARKLGMMHTTYRNASGLPDPDQTTTARDYITLALHLYDDFPQYFKVFKTPVFAWGRARYRNHNGLLFNFQGADGIKTGYTRVSGFNLVESVHRDGKHIIGVIFGGNSVGARNAKMRSLLTAALAKGSRTASRTHGKPRTEVAAARPAAKSKMEITTVTGVGKLAASGSAKSDALGKLIARTAQGGITPEPNPPEPAANTIPAGPYHVQIGSYPTESEARQRLGSIQDSAARVLSGHPPVAVQYNAASKTYYRARFAGFERTQADAACVVLKAKHVDCIVMRAD